MVIKNKFLFLFLGAISCLSGSALAAPSISYYGGVALSWDRMFGDRSESFTDYEAIDHTISKEKSLANGKMNGYAFLGLSLGFDSIPLFISPELQIGQGTASDKLDITINQQGLGDEIIFRRPNPEFTRDFTSSFVVRVGSHFNTPYHLYALGGVEISRFKYNYTWESVNFMDQRTSGFETKRYTKWKTAPLMGIGVEKIVNQHFKVGVECRMALYQNVDISQTFFQDEGRSRETATSTLKPKIASLLLRMSYIL